MVEVSGISHEASSRKKASIVNSRDSLTKKETNIGPHASPNVQLLSLQPRSIVQSRDPDIFRLPSQSPRMLTRFRPVVGRRNGVTTMSIMTVVTGHLWEG